jgi:hypothetical protein
MDIVGRGLAGDPFEEEFDGEFAAALDGDSDRGESRVGGGHVGIVDADDADVVGASVTEALPREPVLRPTRAGRRTRHGVPAGRRRPSRQIATTAGIVVARHRLAVDGTGVLVRDHGHVVALNTAAMAGASSARQHRRKERIPPGPAARTAADTLLGRDTPVATVIDLSAYERAATGRNTLT